MDFYTEQQDFTLGVGVDTVTVLKTPLLTVTDEQLLLPHDYYVRAFVDLEGY